MPNIPLISKSPSDGEQRPDATSLVPKPPGPFDTRPSQTAGSHAQAQPSRSTDEPEVVVKTGTGAPDTRSNSTQLGAQRQSRLSDNQPDGTLDYVPQPIDPENQYRLQDDERIERRWTRIGALATLIGALIALLAWMFPNVLDRIALTRPPLITAVPAEIVDGQPFANPKGTGLTRGRITIIPADPGASTFGPSGNGDQTQPTARRQPRDIDRGSKNGSRAGKRGGGGGGGDGGGGDGGGGE